MQAWSYNRKLIDTLILAVIVLFAALLLSPVLKNGFQMHWDDQVHVVNNPYIKNWSPAYLSKIFTSSYGYQYSPVNTLYWLIVYSLFGLSAAAFHGASLALHLVNVVLVYLFVKRILAGKYDSITGLIISAFTALLFAIHPVQVEAVAWVSANKVLLHAVFYWSGLLCYLSFLDQKRRKWYFLTLLMFILSFGSKEQAVLFPISLIVIDWYYGQISEKKILLLKIPFLALAMLLGYISLVIFDRTGNGGHVFYPLHQRVALGAFSYFEYLFKVLIPLKISYMYFFPIQVGESLKWYFWIYPVLFIMGWWLITDNYRKAGNKVLVFGLLLFTVHLSLFLHIIPLGRSGMIADRYSYMAIPGLVLALIAWLADKLRGKKGLIIIVAIGALLYTGVLCIRTNKQTRVWYDSESLKRELTEQVKLQEDV